MNDKAKKDEEKGPVDLKEKGVSISISSILSAVAVLAIVWGLGKPALLSDIEGDIQEMIDARIVTHSTPLQDAFKVIIQSSINVNKRAIAQLEYDRDNDPDNWSRERARILADRYIELQQQEEAYSKL